MIDIPGQIVAIHREVGRQPVDGGESVGLLLRRTYRAPIDDVWSALTDPDRIRRWFMPVSGDLRAGGNFALQGNASGDILRCEPPRLLRATFGGPTSVIEVRLSPQDQDTTVLELEHTVPIEMAGSGAGSLFVGPGWDGALMALSLHLDGQTTDDPVAAASSPEAQRFSQHSVDAWAAAVAASGTATADEIAAATGMSLAQFAPDLATTSNGDGARDEAAPPAP